MLTRRTFISTLPAALAARPLAAAPAVADKTRLGLAVGFNQYRWADDAALAAEFDDYARLGVGWLRTDFYWHVVQEAGPESMNWSGIDRVLDMAESRGIRILPVAGIAPEWAGHDPSAYADFLHAAARRYRSRGIDHWEVWNEPNLAGPWPPAPDPVAYAAMASAGAAALRDANPKAFVISGGLAAVQTTGPAWGMWHYAADEFLDVVYKEVGGAPFDAIGFHPYSYPELPSETAPDTGWNLMSVRLRDVMSRHGDAGKPVWITEYGAPTNLPQVSPSVQVKMLENAHALMLRTDWLGPLFWYSYRDTGSDPSENEDWFGLRDAQGREKPAFRAFQRLAGQTVEPLR